MRLRRKIEPSQGEKQDTENHFFTGNGASGNADRKASSYLLLSGERSQTQEHFRFFGERFGGEALISELSEAASDLGIDSLAVLTGVDFNT